MGKRIFSQCRLQIVACLAVAAIVLAACQSQPAPAPADWQDGFDNPRSGWQINDNSAQNNFVGYQEGRYVLQTGNRRTLLWGINQQYTTQNSLLAVTAFLDPANTEASFGIICGYQDAEHFYFFEVGADGYYAIVQIIGGEPNFLAGNTQHADIATHASQYQLTVTCNAELLAMSVDGKAIANATPPTAPSGNAGVLLHTYQRGDARVMFDDWHVTALSE